MHEDREKVFSMRVLHSQAKYMHQNNNIDQLPVNLKKDQI